MTNPVLEDDVVERLKYLASGSQLWEAGELSGIFRQSFTLIERLQKELGEAREALAFGTSADAYYNLEGALIDMRRTGVADIGCIRTIERVQQQIAAAAKAIRSMDGGGK